MSDLRPSRPINHHGIIRIQVKNLFGGFNYNIRPEADDLTSVLILYGDNGSGKTTILNLIYHLLTPEPGGGHRTFLAKTQFSQFAVTFADQSVIEAVRPEGKLALKQA